MKERERNGENGKNEAGKQVVAGLPTSAGAGEAEPTALWKAELEAPQTCSSFKYPLHPEGGL